MPKLLVDRKAYRRKGFHRKSYRRKDGTLVESSYVDVAKVPRTRFKIKDRGKLGRGKKLLPKLKEGTLGGSGFFSKSTEERHRIEMAKARKLGEKKVAGKLRAVQVFTKRTSPLVSKKAASDAKYVFKHIGGYTGE